MGSRAPAEESERAVIDGDAACTHGSPTSARAYFGSWSHCPPFHDPPSDGIHFSWPRTSLNPSVPACWIALTSRYILPSFSCGIPRRRAPFRGQSLPFAARAPVRGFGRQLIPVQEPVDTAQTNVFSSPVLLTVATFSAFAAMVLLLPLRRWPMQELFTSCATTPQALRKRSGSFGAVDL